MQNRLIGIDYGFKRIGIASGQTITRSSSCLSTLENERHRTNFDGLAKIIIDWKPDAIVIGLPLNKDGSDHDVSKAVRYVAKELIKRHDLPVYFQDERLSSSEAEAILQTQRADGKKMSKVKKEDIDQLSAAIILQRWIDENVN